VYWQGWISDVSHAPQIDEAIWTSIEQLDLLNNTESKAEPRLGSWPPPVGDFASAAFHQAFRAG
jgi:hypothetical protein